MTKILVVDDEAPIMEVLAYNLKRAGYEVVQAWDGQQALALARREQPDLIILDLMLPELDGLEVCRLLRREREVPIIMLTARDEEVDRVVGLELGADDYVVKPFSVRELLARVKNVLRRWAPHPAATAGELLCVGALQVDNSRHQARLGEVTLELTVLEFELLRVLATQPERVFSREQLLEQVWGYTYHEDLRVVDAVVKRLRAKLRQAAPQEAYLVTVRGVGYKLRD